MIKRFLCLLLCLAPLAMANTTKTTSAINTQAGTAVPKKVLRIGYPGFDWAPFTYVSERGHISGLLPTLMYEIAKASGYTTQTIIYPTFDDVLRGFHNREIDVLVGVSSTFERKKVMHFSQPLLVVPMAVLTKNPAINSVQDMGKSQIAIEQGFAIQEQLAQLTTVPLKLQTYPSSHDAFNAVISDDAAAYIGNAITIKNMMSHQEDQSALQLKELPDLPYERLYLASHREQVPLINELNRGLESLNKHLLNNILDTWLTTSQQRYLTIDSKLNLSEEEREWLEHHDTLKVAYHPDDFPYQFRAANGKMEGISADILAEVGKLLQVSITPVPMTALNKILPGLSSGEFDAIAAVTCTEERQSYFLCTQPYTDESWVMIDNANQADFTAESRIGVLENRYGHALSRELFKDNPLFFFESNEELLRATVTGDVDVAIISLSSASSLLQNDFLGRLNIIESELDNHNHPVGMAVDNNNPVLRELLNKAINAIPPHKFSEIENQWQTVTVHEGIPYKKLLLWGTLITAVCSAIFAFVMYSNRKLSNEIKNRKQAEQKLTYLTNNFDGVLLQHYQRSDDPSDIELLFVSEKIYELVGISAAKLFASPGLIFHLLKQRRDNAAILEAMKQACHKGYWKTELQLESHGSLHRWVELRCHILPRETGWQWNTVMLDITHMKQQQQELEKARQQAEAATVAKSRFLAMMSHEIRTPISGVLSLLELLQPHIQHQEAKSIHNSLTQSGNNLLNIVNDVLDFSKVEAGKLTLSPAACEMNDFIHQLVQPHLVHAEQKGIGFQLWVDPQLAQEVQVDPLRLRQVLNNLLNNATKFTESGHIGLQVEVMRQPSEDAFDPQQTIRFTVEDTGIGISQADTSKLFQPFEQADLSSERRFSGTGLGLSICRQLVQLMGGEIHVESELGKGSQFIFELDCPVLTPAKPHALIERCALINLPQQSYPILHGYLAKWANEVKALSVFDSAQLLTQLQQSKPETVFISEYDYRALELSPTWITTHAADLNWVLLRQATLLSPEPTAAGWVLSVSPLMPTHLQRVLTTPKPEVAPSSLVTSDVNVKSNLDNLDTHTHLALEEASSINANAIKPCAMKPYKILVAEDHPINQQIIAQQLKQLGYQAEIMDNGQQALNALQQRDYDLLLTDCHMPELDGYGLASAVKQHGFTTTTGERLPIIALTANAAASEKNNCKQNGFDQCLFKPINLQQLDDVLNRWLAPHISNEASDENSALDSEILSPLDMLMADDMSLLEAEPTDLDTELGTELDADLNDWDLGDFVGEDDLTDETVKESVVTSAVPLSNETSTTPAPANTTANMNDNVIDMVALSGIFGDPAMCQQIVMQYHEACLNDVDELRQAVSSHNHEAIRLLSHRMKGAARMVEFQALATACEHMEQFALQSAAAITPSASNTITNQLLVIEQHITKLGKQVISLNESITH
ncbi:hypothetical protein A3K86_07125 [Photobacterium jeanii]|uniref:histidine kinase n=1 Tax=Photobacterium jeanii TaxID=858640 RepID=A0A178KN75_9GAMM|nr:transporter substrate-binding domain-containing protein [Photobacterium jeanii]OAN18650.1 hypothetical protein A3K86_07125 [Photobacterium jeanii]PST91670.1 hypothetical protein C9I91_00345 [Photobacterium jeanii]